MTDLDAIAKRAAEAKARASKARDEANYPVATVEGILAADVEALLGRVQDQDDELAGRIHAQMELEADCEHLKKLVEATAKVAEEVAKRCNAAEARVAELAKLKGEP